MVVVLIEGLGEFFGDVGSTVSVPVRVLEGEVQIGTCFGSLRHAGRDLITTATVTGIVFYGMRVPFLSFGSTGVIEVVCGCRLAMVNMDKLIAI